MKSELVSYTSEDSRARPAIVQVGHKWARVVTIDSPVSARKVPASESRHFAPLLLGDKPYPISRARRAFRSAARRLGASQGALEVIRAL